MWHGHPDHFLNKLEQIINTLHDNDIGYFLEVDLRSPDNISEKTKIFHLCPQNKVFHKDKNNDFKKKITPKIYTKAKKLL